MPTHLKRPHAVKLFASLAVIASALFATQSAAGQDKKPEREAKGEVVTELDKAIFYVFHAKDNTYWFGSNDRGVYHYDGKTLINYMMKDGLVSNRIRGIQEDKSGNIYFVTYEGISKFNGNTFVTLVVSASSPAAGWKKEPDDLWFPAAPDNGMVYRYDGKSLYRLDLPKTKIGEASAAKFPRSRFPNAIWSPYDVYTIVKDRKGNVWFGTASAGACCFDGQSFRWLYEDHLTNVEGGGSFGIRSILEDRVGAYWICNTQFRYLVNPKGAPGPDEGFVKYRREKGIEHLKAPDGKDHIYFMAIVEDEKGVLWMASGAFGVWRYDGDKVTRFPVKDGAKDITLFAIYKDNRGDLWLGTHAAGAYKFNGKTFEKFKP